MAGFQPRCDCARWQRRRRERTGRSLSLPRRGRQGRGCGNERPARFGAGRPRSGPSGAFGFVSGLKARPPRSGLITPLDLFAPATGLAGGATEAHWRASISRAYYSAFHAALQWHASLPAPGSVGQASGIHSQLIHQLRAPAPECGPSNAKASREMGLRLDSLRAMRVEADYKLQVAVTQERATGACALALQLIGK